MRLARGHWRETLLLAVFSPGIAELLSSSAPPAQFFIPWVFALFLSFYGAAAILIREATLRRGSGWTGVLLMGVAYTVLEEGLSAKVFFDPASRSLGPLATHGRWMGVNTIWVLDGILYHATFSIALPILLVYQLFPASRCEPWLKRRGMLITTTIFLLAVWVFLAHAQPYVVPGSYQAACWVAIILFALAGLHRFDRNTSLRIAPTGRSSAAPIRVALLGFGATAGMLFQIYVLPTFAGSPLITLSFLVGGALWVAWRIRSWSAPGWTWGLRQECGLLVGALGCLALLALFHEINPTRTYDATGMSLIGLASMYGLYRLWRRGIRLADDQTGPLGPVEGTLP